ncbi:MAG: ribonuclease Y, partial [Thermodesulfobacterium geofontis]
MNILLGIIIGFLIGVSLVIVYLYIQKKEKLKAKKTAENLLKEAQQKAKEIIERAENEAKLKIQQAEIQIKEELLAHKQILEEEFEKRKKEVSLKEERLLHKEENLIKREEALEKKLKEIEELKVLLETEKKEVENTLKQAKEELKRISGLSEKEAKELLLKKLEEELREEKAKFIMKLENEVKEEAKRKSQEILAYAISKAAVPFVTEKTVSVVQLPNEDMKGRIIGREGRNIRTFETLTGVDLLIDDTPEVVVLSCADPLRREIARIALERLIADGRIHPARIEEILKQVEEEMEQHLIEVGEKTCFELGIYGLHSELIKMIGKLKYRTSYGQNVLQHSFETAIIAGALAGELGVDVKKAKKAALLHDIGKAASYEMEGPHALIGAEIVRKYGEEEDIVNAIASHHEDIPITSILGIILQISDALSGARPGARRELLEAYIKRIKELEAIASSFEGVEKAFAIQAGREIRVIVDDKKI